jgi:hypothetical protein
MTLLMTGHPDEAETLHIQTVAHLHKPFSMADFEKMVRGRFGT